MYEEILNNINTVTEYKEGDKLSPINKAYFTKPISKDNFHIINATNQTPNKITSNQPSTNQITSIPTNKKLCFIDGGSSELLRAPNFSLFFIRTYANITKDNKTIADKKIEFYCLAKTKIKDGKIFYGVDLFLDKKADPAMNNFLPSKEDLEMFSFDKTLVVGENRAEISKLGDVARRFAEIKLATELISKLDEGIIILDGNLRATFTNETKYLDELYEKAIANNVLITGLCKTSNLLTEKGNNIINVLNYLAVKNDIKENWYYHPVCSIEEPKHKVEMLFLKLNQGSEYIFRFEVHKPQFHKEQLGELLTLLVKNSNDYSFPGYPYGLIKADHLARIPNQEKEFLKSKILLTLKQQDQKNITSCLKALDAHDVLDRK